MTTTDRDLKPGRGARLSRAGAWLAAAVLVAASVRSSAQGDPKATSRFFVAFHGVRIGSEFVTVTRDQGAFTISSHGQIAPPLDVVTTKFEMTYSLDWQPRKLVIEGALRNQTLAISTSFGLTTAISDVTQGMNRGSVTHEVSPRAVVLPPNYFAAYEVLAARLPSFEIGSRFPVFIAPDGEASATVTKVTPRRIVNPDAATDLREYTITVNRTSGAVTVLVSIDTRNRLAKVVLNEQGIVVIRDDISTVMSREERVRNPGDTDVFIPASGFSLAGTVTIPSLTAAKLPAVILVGGQGNQDRDETHYGVSIFGQLAGRLAEAGFFVVRFDQRGIGQSGGRPEHAGIPEYAQDVMSVATWLGKRREIDPKRIAVISYEDGHAIALTAAGQGSRIRAVGVIGATGLAGREAVLEQQQEELNRLRATSAERNARVGLQQRVNEAVVTGKGWETIPADIRRQADTAWFRSWLLFDPAAAMKKVKQPLLILHGALDRERLPANADRLAALGTARKNAPAAATTKVVVPGVNHVLLTAATGEPDEYDSLPEQTIPAAVVSPLVDWLKQVLK
ncbi:MAG TPA: alpha/beta hydrolase [Vicinamibacterales bacterium]|nr:alpha/beta hydrolase [Vicinamibacterales bacterium]